METANIARRELLVTWQLWSPLKTAHEKLQVNGHSGRIDASQLEEILGTTENKHELVIYSKALEALHKLNGAIQRPGVSVNTAVENSVALLEDQKAYWLSMAEKYENDVTTALFGSTVQHAQGWTGILVDVAELPEQVMVKGDDADVACSVHIGDLRVVKHVISEQRRVAPRGFWRSLFQ
jgi:hypothetical protein